MLIYFLFRVALLPTFAGDRKPKLSMEQKVQKFENQKHQVHQIEKEDFDVVTVKAVTVEIVGIVNTVWTCRNLVDLER